MPSCTGAIRMKCSRTRRCATDSRLLARSPRSRAIRRTRKAGYGIRPAPVDTGATLLPAAETTARKEAEEAHAGAEGAEKSGELDVGAVFAKLKQLGGKHDDKQDE
jgi:hypothetical protein